MRKIGLAVSSLVEISRLRILASVSTECIDPNDGQRKTVPILSICYHIKRWLSAWAPSTRFTTVISLLLFLFSLIPKILGLLFFIHVVDCVRVLIKKATWKLSLLWFKLNYQLKIMCFSSVVKEGDAQPSLTCARLWHYCINWERRCSYVFTFLRVIFYDLNLD